MKDFFAVIGGIILVLIALCLFNAAMGAAILVLSWAFSILLLLALVGAAPLLAFYLYSEQNFPLAVFLAIILFLVSLGLVVHFWTDILQWSYMFPTLSHFECND